MGALWTQANLFYECAAFRTLSNVNEAEHASLNASFNASIIPFRTWSNHCGSGPQTARIVCSLSVLILITVQIGRAPVSH